MEPSDFQLFGPLMKCLAVKQFATDANVKQAVTFWPQTLDTGVSNAGIQALVPWWN
jgi:hypothetical protein